MDPCSICLESLNAETTQFACGHSFHEICANQWLLRKISCPLCRTNIVPPVVHAHPQGPYISNITETETEYSYTVLGITTFYIRNKGDIELLMNETGASLDECINAYHKWDYDPVSTIMELYGMIN